MIIIETYGSKKINHFVKEINSKNGSCTLIYKDRDDLLMCGFVVSFLRNKYPNANIKCINEHEVNSEALRGMNYVLKIPKIKNMNSFLSDVVGLSIEYTAKVTEDSYNQLESIKKQYNLDRYVLINIINGNVNFYCDIINLITSKQCKVVLIGDGIVINDVLEYEDLLCNPIVVYDIKNVDLISEMIRGSLFVCGYQIPRNIEVFDFAFVNLALEDIEIFKTNLENHI